MLQQAVTNRIPFRYVLNDVWFAWAETMLFVKQTLQKDFVMPLKANRKVALSAADKQQGRYVSLATLDLEPQATREIYLEGVDFPLLLIKQVFANEDRSTGLLYLVTSDRTLSYDAMTTLYRKTMERGAVSQILEAECVAGTLADPHGHDANQSFLCRTVWLHQAGTVKERNQAHALCAQSQAVCTCLTDGL